MTLSAGLRYLSDCYKDTNDSEKPDNSSFRVETYEYPENGSSKYFSTRLNG
jgi:hypothetical protein